LSQTDVKKSGEKQEVTSRTTKGKATKGEKNNKTRKPCFMRLKVLEAASEGEILLKPSEDRMD